MLAYFVGPKHPSGNCYISCFLTDRTPLSRVMILIINRANTGGQQTLLFQGASTGDAGAKPDFGVQTHNFLIRKTAP